MATMSDVAQRAGVSIATVSHVINETRFVTKETRARVWAAIEELGYRPNRLARSLVRGETHTLGLIAPDNANPFFAEVARGVEDTSFEDGYNVILCNSYNDLDKGLRYADVLSERRVDGILLVSAGMSTAHILDLRTQGMPYDNIYLSAFANPPLTTTVDPQYEQGVLATEVLLQRMRNPDTSPWREVLNSRLLVRQSTAPV